VDGHGRPLARVAAEQQGQRALNTGAVSYDRRVRVADFDFHLPSELIAQQPAPERAASRLMIVNRASGAITAARSGDLPDLLTPGDLVVVNDTRVFPARLRGCRVPSGGHVECLLLRRLDAERWDALVHPGQKLHPGSLMRFEGHGAVLEAEILGQHTFGRRTIRLWRPDGGDVDAAVDAIGEVPLPPYIKRTPDAHDRERYQTVYAKSRGSVAAPTAGLHLSEGTMARLEACGIERTAITLHVGYGTFQPVRTEAVEAHRIDPEPYAIGPDASAAITAALDAHRRIVAVGTTTTRTLEAVAGAHGGRVPAGSGYADLFIHPGFQFGIVGGLLTNFHLPQSSLLMLVCAFGGRDLVLDAYRQAVAERYRFYSYGDAMLLL
jgi:S-adenosylmethionine:tRNA ribosyltransferase-isomerase